MKSRKLTDNEAMRLFTDWYDWADKHKEKNMGGWPRLVANGGDVISEISDVVLNPKEVVEQMKTPFRSEKEYRYYCEKTGKIDDWAKHILNTIVPGFANNSSNSLGETFEGAEGDFIINYYIGNTDDQDWIPIECLWSDNWKDIVTAAKDEEKRKYKERQKQRDVKRTADIEVDERKLFATLIEKYPDRIIEMCSERHQYDCCPEDE